MAGGVPNVLALLAVKDAAKLLGGSIRLIE